MRALVRRPSPRLAAGIVTHIDRQPVDVELAMSQWERYVATLQRNGWETIEVPPVPDCPDSAFVEDTVLVYANAAVIARSAAPTSARRDRSAPPTRCTVSATRLFTSPRPEPSMAATH